LRRIARTEGTTTSGAKAIAPAAPVGARTQ
jgi:hypothetical protein